MITVSETAITLFGVQIHFYALMIVAGILAAVLLASKRERRLDLPAETSLDLALIGVPCALVGARLYYVLFSWDSYANDVWWKVFAVWEGGLAVYGGILAGLLAGFCYGLKKKLRFLRLADLAAPSIALGQAIGRWGNFINKEAYGSEVINKCAQFFPNAVNINGTWHYATFFYESAWCFCIVAAILIAERKRKFTRCGDIFFTYVFLYTLERGVVEMLRTDSLYIGTLRVSQILSLLVSLCIAVALIFRSRRTKTAFLAPIMSVCAIVFAISGCFLGVLIASIGALICAGITYLSIQKQEIKQ